MKAIVIYTLLNVLIAATLVAWIADSEISLLLFPTVLI